MRSIFRYLREKIPLNEAAYLLLIYISMYAVLLGVELVIRGTSVEVLHALIVLGILTGWLLGRSTLRTGWVILIALVSGLVLTVIHVNGIDAAIADLAGSSLAYLWRLAFGGVSDLAELAFQLSVIQTRAQEAFSGVSNWMVDLTSGFMIYNQVSTLYSWGFLMWLFSSWFSWVTLRKGQPIWGMIPVGTMLAILMTYTLQKRFTLVVLLGAGLILIGMVNHDLKQRKWKKLGVKGAEQVRERLYLTVIGFSLYTMVFAGIMPSVRIKPIADRFERLVYGEEEGEGEGGLEGTIDLGGFNSDLYSIQRFAGLPRQKLIGSGPELAQRVVMIVSYPTISLVESELPSAARYWRSYTYDQYTGSGWQSSPTVEVSYQPGQEISGIFSDAFDVVTQEFRLGNAVRGTLYSAGPPVTLDHEALVSWRTVVEEGTNGESQIVGMADIFAVTLDPIQYQVRSLVSNATDEDLRGAEGAAPEWIVERYSQLPDTVPDRVLALAAEIVANQPSRYDQAKAIETFLRTYPYNLELPAPPLDRDVADYFLFEIQTGYCDYYATSMVVLSRAVGLPARAVVGFAGGQYDQENDYYLVSEADAHTWVEIYFEGYGWIPFEPTAARNLLDEEELALPLPPELVSLPQAVDVEEEGDFPWWQVGLGITVLAILTLWIREQADLARLGRMDATSLILTIYLRLYRYGRWMGASHLRSDTLYEFNDRMGRAFQKLAANPRRAKRLEGVHSELAELTDYAVKANYGQQPLDARLNERIIQTWKTLRRRLRYAVRVEFWRVQVDRIRFWSDRSDDLAIIGDGAADGTR